MARPTITDKRKNLVRIRLTDDELAELRQLIGDKPISTFIREVLFEKRKFFIPTSDYIKTINELVREQKKIGNNLNQATKEMHSEKLVNPKAAVRVDEFIEKVSELYSLESKMNETFLELVRKAKSI
jgi:predicted transcriptional regulator